MMSLKTKARQVAETSLVSLTLENVHLMIGRAAFRFRSSNPQLNILIPAPGQGNIGDQAMLESFLDNVAGPVTVVPRNAGHMIVEGSPERHVSVVELPRLIYTNPVSHIVDAVRLAILLRNAKTLSIIGADLMDGGYQPLQSVQRIAVLRMAQAAGVKSQVTAFSWNKSPAPTVRRLLRRAAANGVGLVARDPDSYKRLIKDGIKPVTEGMDIAFLLEPGELPSHLEQWISQQSRCGRPIIGVNLSALVDRSIDQVAVVGPALTRLQDNGSAIILIPHVDRPGQDDVKLARSMAEMLSPTQTFVICELVRPRQIAAITGNLDAIFTGRMHLGILGLSQGTPALIVSTQSKVRGLVEKLGHPELVIEVGEIDENIVYDKMRCIIDNSAGLRKSVMARIPDVKSDANATFRLLSPTT